MAARATKAARTAAIKPNTLIVDNGGFTIKAGLATPKPSSNDCHIIPNFIARDQDRKVYVGAQIEKCKDFFHLVMRRPVERGMIVNWEQERAIWHESFLSENNALIKCDPHETNLILAEAPNVFPVLQSNCDQIVFEECEFASYYRCIGSSLNAYGPKGLADYMLVIDSGYSHTTVTPLVNGQPVQSGIRRLDIGGKHLTNYLSELLAIHEVSLKEDPWIANEVKEACCFITDDFKRDMERTWRGHNMDPTICVDVQLPDYQEFSNVVVKPFEPKAASLRTKSDVATLGNERFQVPEILFNPGDIGMVEGGLAELVMQSVSQLPESLQHLMLANVLLVGGNALLPGFLERLRVELRQLVPSDMKITISGPEEPVKSTWLGGAYMASDEALLTKHLVTKKEYEEHGSNSNWLANRFRGTGT
ncbi:Actin/actin-like protein [Microthyrium microscopicum]|uniref:Actin-like protein ARP6 n=1 Tax=Microthyrium microscopicum TaxID=703497 RepID=A0A6A6TXJ3_9PEZI|nr:Actin/actin-like protein [Microthyrium microscopicum]